MPRCGGTEAGEPTYLSFLDPDAEPNTESFTTVYTTDRHLLVRVRKTRRWWWQFWIKRPPKIKTFVSGGSVVAVRGDDET